MYKLYFLVFWGLSKELYKVHHVLKICWHSEVWQGSITVAHKGWVQKIAPAL